MNECEAALLAGLPQVCHRLLEHIHPLTVDHCMTALVCTLLSVSVKLQGEKDIFQNGVVFNNLFLYKNYLKDIFQLRKDYSRSVLRVEEGGRELMLC